MNHASLLEAVQSVRAQAADASPPADASSSFSCPVYLAETYGIIGFDEERQKNVELMEKGRGSEYGFVGGSGGRGVPRDGIFRRGVVRTFDTL
jgi:hypothetical protein